MAGVNQLNNPKSSKVKELFASTVGIEDVTEAWVWEIYDQKASAGWIDNLVSMRGAVAHGRNPEIPVHAFSMVFLTQLVMECAFRTNNYVTDFVEKVTGKSLWPQLRSNADWQRFSKEAPPESKGIIVCHVPEDGEHFAQAVPISPGKQ